MIAAQRDRQQLRAYGFIVIAAVMWGTLGVMAKALYGWGVSPWSVVFYRALLGFAACALIVAVVDIGWLRVRRQDLPFLVLYSFLGTSAFFILYLVSISLSTVAVAAVLLYTAPAFATLIARFTFGEAVTATKVVALLLSFAGCVLVVSPAPGQVEVSALGVIVGLGSAITYALFGIMGKQARQRYHAMTIQFYTLAFGTLLLVPVLALPGASLGPYPVEVWLLLAGISIGLTLLARLFYITAVKHVEASRAAILATVEPAWAALFAYLLLGEALSTVQVIGGLLVLSGAALAQQRRRP